METKRRGRHIRFSDNENVMARARKKLGLKQADMAKLLRLHPSAIGAFETGTCKISGPVAIICELLLRDPDILKILE